MATQKIPKFVKSSAFFLGFSTKDYIRQLEGLDITGTWNYEVYTVNPMKW